MTAPTRHHWLSLPVQLALAVLGWGGVCTADARGACGDYVQILGESPGNPQHDPVPAAPCHGPVCDRQVPPAAPSSPVPTTGQQTQLDVVLPAADAPDRAKSAALVGRMVPVPNTFPSTVFRPPRPLY
jgi:hypothetical protein